MDIKETSAKPGIAEMKRRAQKVQATMSAEGLDYYISFSPDNILWLTNFANIVHERPFILALPVQGDPIFLAPKLELPHIRSRKIGDIDLVTYAEFPAPAGQRWEDRLSEIVTPGAKIGIESVCPVQIAGALPGKPVVIDIVDNHRIVKSEYELGRIAYSCRIVSEAHGNFLNSAHIGQTQSEVSGTSTKAIFGNVLKDNPELNPLATKIICLFQNSDASDDPHNFSNIDMAIQEGGPHLTVFNSMLNGYGAEIERCFFIDHVPEEAKHPFETMMAARQLSFDLTKPGAIMGDIDRQVNELFIKAGYSENLLHRTGHGIGITGHEAPFLADGYDMEIQPGMVFTIEPGIYISGIGGFRHSDTVMITADGNKSLTFGATDLDSLTLSS